MGDDDECVGFGCGGGDNIWDDIWNGVSDTGQAIGTAVEFGQDPIGFLFDKAREAAYGLSHSVLPALFDATKPDLSLSWFTEAYRIAFAVAILLWIFLLLWTIVRSAQGKYTSHDVAEVLTWRAYQFLGGAMFGPAIGWFMLQVVGSLTETMAGWALTSSTNEALDGLTTMIEATDDPAGVVGGSLIALLLMVGMLLGLLLVVITLVVTLIAVYMGGAVFPLAWAWLTEPTHRRIATKLLWLLGGIVFSKPLLFFLLGIAYRMMSSNTTWLDDGNTDLATVVNLVAGACAVFLAGLAPFALFKFAPVSPAGAGQSGASFGAPGGSRGRDGDTDESGPSRHSRRRARESQDDPSGSESSGGRGGDGGGGSGGSGGHEPGPIESAVKAKQNQAATGSASPGGGGAGAGGGAAGSGGSPAAGAGGAKPVPAGAGAGAGGGAAAGAGAGAGAGAAGGAAGGAAAGSAAAPGVGTVVGAGIGIAGAAAVAAAQETARRGVQGAQLAASEMDDAEEGRRS